MSKEKSNVQPSAIRLSFGRDVFRIASIALAYLLAHHLAFLFPDSEEVLMAVWPAGGVGLAALLLNPRRLWPAILAAFFVVGNSADWLTGRPFFASVGFMTANVLESATCAWLISRWCGASKVRFTRVNEVLALIFAATVMNACTSFIGAGAATLAIHARYWDFWLTWWVADGLGILLITPLIVTWAGFRDLLLRVRWTRAVEWMAFMALWCTTASLAFQPSPIPHALYLLPYMLVALLAWAALRLGQRGVTIALVVLACITSTAVTTGPLLWGGESAEARLLLAQVYLAFVAVIGFLLAASYAESKSAERSLRESEARYRLLVETTIDGIWVVDENFRTTYVNRAMAEMLGHSEAEIIGKTGQDFMFPEDHEEDSLQKAGRREGLQSRYERRFRRKDGTSMWVFSSASPIFDEDGQFAGAFAILTDITERKQMEETLRESETRFRAALEHVPDGVFIHDSDGRFLMVNEVACRLTGYSREELLRMRVADLDADSETRDYVHRYWQTPQAVPALVEAVHRRKDGTQYPAEVHVSRMTLDGELRILAVVRDVTERKRAAEERLAMELRLQHAQKLESLGVLAGGIAHDFNNILMAIMGNASMAHDELPPLSPGREYLAEIDKASRRAAELCRQMLAYSGRGKFVVEAICLRDLIEEMVHLLRTSISKKAVLNLNLEKDLPPMEGDATQIRQVVMNLITNASEAIGERSGVITVSTGAMDCSREYLRKIAFDENLNEGLYVYVEVSDTGCGMTRETMDRVFEPFFTTKFTGRGLGMAAVLGIVRGHQGAIRIHSQVGKGTTFRILFPASQAALQSADARSGSEDDGWKGRGCVLLVDDEDTIRALGKRMLEHIGYEVLTAADGREALDVYRQQRERIAFVLLDLTMPHMDGEETFLELRRTNPAARVVVSSGYTEQDTSARFAGKGWAGFIQKPYSLTTLKERLRSLGL